MTSHPAQCGRTFPHLDHETTAGDCPGLASDRLAAALITVTEALGFPVGEARAFVGRPDEPPMTQTLADAESDPLRSWVLAYPGPSANSTLDPGSGPGWGDDSDVENARCCPWCRGSLTDHNREVHAAGYALGERHSTEDLQRLATDTVMNAARDPWASDGAGYDVRVLRSGIQAIASAAIVREDFGTAAYAYSVLAGEPIAPRYDDEPDTSAEDLAPRVYMASAQTILIQAPLPDQGVLVLPGDGPTGVPTINATVPDPADEACGAAAYGVRFAACDLPAGHNSQHHAWYDAGHGPTTILWDRS